MSSAYLRKSQAKIKETETRETAGPPKDDKVKSGDGKLPLRVAARIVVILSLMTIVYVNGKNDKIKALAKQSEMLPGRGQVFDCSEDYRKDLYMYDGCFPKDCGRFITDILITEKESEAMLEIAKKGLALGGSAGGASILDLHSGALSKQEHFVDFYKIAKAKDVFTEADFNIYKLIKNKIQHGVAQHFGVTYHKLYLTHPTFFSQLTGKEAATIHDEYWHPHVDKETYKSFHFTTLLYLNDYGKDFNGGKFIFIDEKHNATVEPRKGRVSMFTSGSENYHYVEKVQSGVRYAATISFTCDKKYAIADPTMKKFND